MSRLAEDVLVKLRQMAEEVSQREGCLLYDLEFTGGTRNRILRVFIDRPEGTVTVDDCANVSRGLNLQLDVGDLIPGGAYELEVSSPGIDRRLNQTWHFQKVLGQGVRISTTSPIPLPEGIERKEGKSGPMSIEGELVGAEDELVVVKKQEVNWEVPRAIIRQAKVVFDFQANRGKKKKKR
ncbi:MAG: ribosome maturation factor RimP [Bdellovibrionaceae bacterium]|nr:ribosome maturation factor RimP [Pseudobdellovibrionaceae bacterium]